MGLQLKASLNGPERTALKRAMGLECWSSKPRLHSTCGEAFNHRPNKCWLN
jgi:hypothetical protein